MKTYISFSGLLYDDKVVLFYLNMFCLYPSVISDTGVYVFYKAVEMDKEKKVSSIFLDLIKQSRRG